MENRLVPGLRRACLSRALFAAALLLLVLGCEDFITYQVWDGVPTIEPQAITLDLRETRTFVASGGKPPYRFAIVSGGGSIDSSSGI